MQQAGFVFDEPRRPPWTLVCDDVLHWAETYTGPKFHAMLCDPPYHLISETRHGSARTPGTGPYGRHTLSTKGFMGKEWDGGSIAFQPETWKALAQHLLPGAFIMAFGGSRTHHRLACALEDAGLIIHPSIVWLKVRECTKWLERANREKGIMQRERVRSDDTTLEIVSCVSLNCFSTSRQS